MPKHVPAIAPDLEIWAEFTTSELLSLFGMFNRAAARLEHATRYKGPRPKIVMQAYDEVRDLASDLQVHLLHRLPSVCMSDAYIDCGIETWSVNKTGKLL